MLLGKPRAYSAMTSHHLQNWMDKIGLSTDDTAKAFGLSRRTVQSMLSGKSRIPVLVELACICVEKHGD